MVSVSFEDSFDEQLRGEIGDLGPDSSSAERPDAARAGRRGGRRRHR